MSTTGLTEFRHEPARSLAWTDGTPKRYAPMSLLRQNSELRGDRIWNWTIPAATTTLPDGRHINCCPMADGCVLLCYARTGTYRFSNVVAAHQQNLMRVLDDLDGWEKDMIEELRGPRFRPSRSSRRLPFPLDPWARSWAHAGGAAVRIHDAGDFFSDAYTEAWLRIASATRDVLFYCYTKEVSRFRRLVEPVAPVNLRWIYSLGGKEDHLLDLKTERHADVFPTAEALDASGYTDQSASDLIAVLAPAVRIGIPANNHQHIRRRMGEQTFGTIQTRRTLKRLAAKGIRSADGAQPTGD